MKPIVLIHGYSAESPASDPTSIASIYGILSQRLRASYDVVEVDLSRYVRLNDSVSFADIARGLNRALLEAVPTFSILRSRSRPSSRRPRRDPLVTYLPLRIPLNRRQLTSWIQSRRTTIIDVNLLRLPAPEVYQLTKS